MLSSSGIFCEQGTLPILIALQNSWGKPVVSSRVPFPSLPWSKLCRFTLRRPLPLPPGFPAPLLHSAPTLSQELTFPRTPDCLQLGLHEKNDTRTHMQGDGHGADCVIGTRITKTAAEKGLLQMQSHHTAPHSVPSPVPGTLRCPVCFSKGDCPENPPQQICPKGHTHCYNGVLEVRGGKSGHWGPMGQNWDH